MNNEKNEERNTLYIGKKPVLTYVLSMISAPEKKMILAARGRYMAKAIDVYEVFKNKLGKDCKATFTTNTVNIENRNVSELLISVTWK